MLVITDFLLIIIHFKLSTAQQSILSSYWLSDIGLDLPALERRFHLVPILDLLDKVFRVFLVLDLVAPNVLHAFVDSRLRLGQVVVVRL